MIFDDDISPARRRQTITPVQNEIIVYGTTWCGMTQMIRRFLDRLDIQYRYLDIEEDDGAANQLKWLTGGYTSHPTVVIDGQTLVEPDLEEFERALVRNGYV
jgi:mycoredoxin